MCFDSNCALLIMCIQISSFDEQPDVKLGPPEATNGGIAKQTLSDTPLDDSKLATANVEDKIQVTEVILTGTGEEKKKKSRFVVKTVATEVSNVAPDSHSGI